MDGERRRAYRAASVGAGAMALPVLLLANQSLGSWRDQEFVGIFTGTSVPLGRQAMGLLAQIAEFFSWRWSPSDVISRLGATTSISIGSYSVAAQDVSDLAYVVLAWLLLAGVARSWRPRPGWAGPGAAVWGVSVLAGALSGLVVPQLFGVPVAGAGVLVTMVSQMADRAPGGLLFGAFAALVVVITEAAVARRSPEPVGEEPNFEGMTDPAALDGGSPSAGGPKAQTGPPDGVAVLPEQWHGGEDAHVNGTGRPVSSDVEFLGDFELGEAGPPSGPL